MVYEFFSWIQNTWNTFQGRVRVVRMQTVVDVQNESKFAYQKTEELGFGRSFSHADGNCL